MTSKKQPGSVPYHIICTKKLAEKRGVNSFCKCPECREKKQDKLMEYYEYPEGKPE